MDVYLVRHGESEANAKLTDELDSALTPLGYKQAEFTARRLVEEGITRAYVSPLLRTLLTIEPFCRDSRLRATAYADVCEYFSPNYPGYLTFKGLSPEEIQARFPFVDFDPNFRCEMQWWPAGFENYRVTYDRSARVRDTLISKYGNTAEKILIVSHADPIGRLIEAFTRVEPNPQSPPWSDNCAMTILRIPADTAAPAVILAQNDSSHLNPLYDHAT